MSTRSGNIILRQGVDYFTLTAPWSFGNQGAIYDAIKEARSICDKQLKSKRWKFFGYEGEIYRSGETGHFAYGESFSDIMGLIVQASGEMASLLQNIFFGLMPRCSRIDLAVDVELRKPDENYFQTCWKWIQKNVDNKQRRYSIVENSLRGTTLYVGTRVSENFGRIYDKGVETGQATPGKQIRYEIEYKGKVAKKAYQDLVMATEFSGSKIIATVYEWFEFRQVPPLFKKSQATGLDTKVVFHSADEAKLLWLRTAVAPTVRYFLMDNKLEVLEALGVTEFLGKLY